MPIVQQMSGLLTSISGPLGVFVFPVVIIAAAALLIFARYSYRCFRVVLPIAGVVLGSIVGMSITDFLIATFAIDTSALPIAPEYIVGIVLAAALGIFCFKFNRFTVLLAGGGLGYVVVGSAVVEFFKLFPFVQAVESTTEASTVETVDMIVALICMVVCAYFVNKYFKTAYIFVTTIGVSIVALAFVAVLLFQNSAIVDTAAIVGAVCGLVTGIVFYGIQSYETLYY